jgi:hypothetical protein
LIEQQSLSAGLPIDIFYSIVVSPVAEKEAG